LVERLLEEATTGNFTASLDLEGTTSSGQTNAQAVVRMYEDRENDELAFLPPIPQLASGDAFSFTKVPYPVDVCIAVSNVTSYKFSFQSFKFRCDSGDPKMSVWADDATCTSQTGVDKVSLVGSVDIEHGCDVDIDVACPYVELKEQYYLNQTSSTSSECDEIGSSATVLPTAYYGTYAVDACIKNDMHTDRYFKYSCNDQTKTYTVKQYTDESCSENEEVITELVSHESLQQCVGPFNLDVLDLNSTFNITIEDAGFEVSGHIVYAQANFVSCSKELEYETADELDDYCVSTQITAFVSAAAESTTVAATGPFGARGVAASPVQLFAGCDVCNVTGTCSSETLASWNNSALLVDSGSTASLSASSSSCSAADFVREIQEINEQYLVNATVRAVIFEAGGYLTAININDSSIYLPVRQVESASDIINAKAFSLACNQIYNYRPSYPIQVCIYVDCELFVDAANCKNIEFSGTYLIQNTDADEGSYFFNANPTYKREGRAGFASTYIWLQAYNDADAVATGGTVADVSPYVSLRWVISAEIGDTTGGLYCNVPDINQGLDRDELSDGIAIDFKDYTGNFVPDCEWQNIDVSTVSNKTVVNVVSAPYQCFDNLRTKPIEFACINSYQSIDALQAFMGTYYEVAEFSGLYVQRANGSNGTFSKLLHHIDCEPYDSIDILNNTYILCDAGKSPPRIEAFCVAQNSSSLESASLCREWKIWNSTHYTMDSSFDVDTEECDYDNIDIPENPESALCFELNNADGFGVESNADMDLYSNVQYLWGEYTKVDDYEFQSRAIYRNTRLKGTDFDTFLIWYDPKDSYVFLTKSDFLTNVTDEEILEDESILVDIDFEQWIVNSHLDLIDNIVAYCDVFTTDDDVYNNEEQLPQDCLTWNVNQKLFNVSSLTLVAGSCNNSNGVVDDSDIDADTDNNVEDLCVAFYDIVYEEEVDSNGEITRRYCVTECEKAGFSLNEQEECELADYFEANDDWCNATETDSCPTVDANGIYSQFNQTKRVSNRPFWTHEESSFGDYIYTYVYYHEYLRLWVFATDQGVNEGAGDNEETLEKLEDLGIFAYCLKWQLSTPTECEIFYYPGLPEKKQNACISDCTVHENTAELLEGLIAAWAVIGCLGLGFIVFVCGFYKEWVDKRAQKNKKVTVQQDTQVALTTQLNSNQQPDTIQEEQEEEDDHKEEEQQEEEAPAGNDDENAPLAKEDDAGIAKLKDTDTNRSTQI